MKLLEQEVWLAQFVEELRRYDPRVDSEAARRLGEIVRPYTYILMPRDAVRAVLSVVRHPPVG